MRALRKTSEITVGDRALEDFHIRAATQRGRAITAEGHDWKLLTSVLLPGERQRARVAVKFPQHGNASGFAFVTDQRLLLAFREQIVALSLAYVRYVGRPDDPRAGDLLVAAQMPGAGRYPAYLRIRDTEAFQGFFPTLIDALRARGADAEIAIDWPVVSLAGEAEAGVVASTEPPVEVVERGLAAFMREGEYVVEGAELAHAVDGAPITLILTQWRLIAIEGPVICAASLENVTVRESDDPRSRLYLTLSVLDDVVILAGGLADVDRGARRLALRPRTENDTCEWIYRQLRRR